MPIHIIYLRDYFHSNRYFTNQHHALVQRRSFLVGTVESRTSHQGDIWSRGNLFYSFLNSVILPLPCFHLKCCFLKPLWKLFLYWKVKFHMAETKSAYPPKINPIKRSHKRFFLPSPTSISNQHSGSFTFEESNSLVMFYEEKQAHLKKGIVASIFEVHILFIDFFKGTYILNSVFIEVMLMWNQSLDKHGHICTA